MDGGGWMSGWMGGESWMDLCALMGEWIKRF